MVKLPAVGFMQDTNCTLLISFRDSLLLSYLGAQQKPQTLSTARAATSAVPSVCLWAARTLVASGGHILPLSRRVRCCTGLSTQGPAPRGNALADISISWLQVLSKALRSGTGREMLGNHRSDSGRGCASLGWGRQAAGKDGGAAVELGCSRAPGSPELRPCPSSAPQAPRVQHPRGAAESRAQSLDLLGRGQVAHGVPPPWHCSHTSHTSLSVPNLPNTYSPEFLLLFHWPRGWGDFVKVWAQTQLRKLGMSPCLCLVFSRGRAVSIPVPLAAV